MLWDVPDVVRTIQLLVAPVVMVSAAGLVCLALYNRLAVVVGRIRAIHKETHDALSHLSVVPAPRPGSRAARRVVTLDEQVAHLMKRARLVRGALLCLLGGMLSMFTCVIVIALWLVWREAAYLALGVFLVGVLLDVAAVVLAMLELRVSLVAAALEAASIDPRSSLGQSEGELVAPTPEPAPA